MKGTIIGAEVPIPLGGRFANRVGLALAFYEPTDVVVRGRVLYPEKTQFPMLDNRAQSVTIRAALGVDVGYGIRLGVGFAALAEVVGTVVAATDASGRVGTRVEDQLVATYAPSFGATYDLPVAGPAKWRIGATYRGTLDARFAIVIDGSKLSSLQIPLFNISGLAQYDPAQAAIEVARHDHLNVLAAQVVYKHWSGFPGVLEPTLVCSEGGAGGCGLTPPKIDWKDTFVVRLGADQGFEIARARSSMRAAAASSRPRRCRTICPGPTRTTPRRRASSTCPRGTSTAIASRSPSAAASRCRSRSRRSTSISSRSTTSSCRAR